MKGIFITGTDTGVGKTFVTASLCRALRKSGINAVALKPFATGLTAETPWIDNDPLVLSAAMDGALQPEVISPVWLTSPLSPYDAARVSHTAFDVEAVAEVMRQIASRYDVALIEGVGGPLVPLTDTVSVAGFAKLLDLPVLLVARSRIGTINHTLLSAKALRDEGLHLEGVVFNRMQSGPLELDEKYGPDTACRFARLASFGFVDHHPGFAASASEVEAVNHLGDGDEAIIALADHVRQAALQQ